MTTAEQLRRDADDIWQHLLEHSFVTELYSGELPRDAFTFYVLHDYHYLTTAMQNFSIIASKAPTVDEMRAVIDLLHMEAESEYRGYRELVERLGYTLQDAASLEPIPISVSYGSYLLATSALQSYAEAITAVLPCFWSYAEIADQHRDRLPGNDVQLYRDWAAVYDTDEYRDVVRQIQQLVNRAADDCTYNELLRVFTTSSRYEYLFWDAVYNRQEWPV